VYADVPAPARALDLGAGTGAAGAALRARFGAGLEVVAVDRVAAPGIVACDLARDVPGALGRFDLVVAAHLMGELFLGEPPERRIDALTRRVWAWRHELCAEGATMILLEPALRETSRALLAVRDRLLASPGVSVVAPCFWTGPCPALARERDWCHDAAPVPSSPRVDFSYLVLRAHAAAPPPPGAFRVVSDRLDEKGRLKIFGCGASGRHAIVRLDRAASPGNAAFAHLERGDVVTLEGCEPAGDGLRVGPEARVARGRRAE
jgi:hypothetical protein